MQYQNLGKSPLKVSRLCLGTMMFADQTELAEARSIVDHAQEHGVNFIDTADVYSKGRSEAMVGELLKGRRHDWVLATKLGNMMSERPNESQYSRAWVLRECEASLQRLATDHIDIYYLHRDFNGMDLEEPLRAIATLLQQGKIRYWGVSNFRGWRIAEMVHMARALNMPGPVVCQPYYNLLNRQPEVEVLPVCAHHGIGVVPYSPIARGVLSGKYAPGSQPAEGSRAARGDKRMLETEFREESLQVAQTLKAHCDGSGRALSHFATAWVLANPRVSSVIAGPRTLAQWTDYLGALDCVISAEDEALVDSLVRPGHPSTPGYTDPAYPLNGR
ncbi:aldo/keto reductase [Roseateles toxinivorans]|uniref:Aryl-alcohol dehydrogenase-like predicted oxidoreductase n=1 Tax=Roseateles toxinivorans TaxID=270368 RepID=A0A4R6QI32_9BURK|nr:aldo/keto reductase [Roseateles toxinivorans]TDP62270.1 aryl-alcohol dehydrogenase-like predicted oxidoreductase [Roseateles toxinivorans]